MIPSLHEFNFVPWILKQLLWEDRGPKPSLPPGFIHYGNPAALDGPAGLPPGTLSRLVIRPARPDAFQTLLQRPVRSLHWLPASRVFPPRAALPFSDPVPVLFWGDGYEDGTKPFAEWREDGTVVFHADILAAALFMLSRWEETAVPTRDAHGRFPAEASVACRQGFLDRPIVDEYALILHAWLKTLLPEWKPPARQFSIKLSHDIDSLQCYPNVNRVFRVLAGDLLKRRNWRLAWKTVVESIHALINPQTDPHLQGIELLAHLSEIHGFQSAFYFMGARRSAMDIGYDPASPIAQSCLADLRRRGHEIGFHAGYYTFEDPERFAEEKARLTQSLGNGRLGGRQHYLRFRAPDTWRIWEKNGMAYDSTLSYAEQEGYRCGTCHPFQPYDLVHNRPLDILEIPLIIMDGALRQYRKLTPEEGEQRILTLAQRCKNVNGAFTLLWHNTSLAGDWREWGEMYRRVLPQLARLRDEGDSCAS
ncbi:MAG: polysaccharide deacetylase family protein [bacterium]